MNAAAVRSFWRQFSFRVFLAIGLLAASTVAQTAAPSAAHFPQASAVERTFPLPKAKVEKALRDLQTSMSGKLPALDGFALEGLHPLARYQRGFYQSSVQVSSLPSGGSRVRVTTKVTAWYPEKTAGASGYQLLTSNGRLESDLLDQLSEALGVEANGAAAVGDSAAPKSAAKGAKVSSSSEIASGASALSAPTSTQKSSGLFAAPPASAGLTKEQLAATSAETKSATRATVSAADTSLEAQATALEEVLKNQAHPKNLVAIKKSGTPVVSTPSLNGKTLFMASAQDEFEMLDFNADWVHVRISGLSRGWIWRTSLEMPEGISDVPKVASKGASAASDLFQISREEKAAFPGDWAPLRGKNVKIISVQKIQENSKDSGPQAKLEYTKSLLDKNYAEISAKGQELAGIVLIFDSVDGGMIAATLPTVRAWKAGTLSDAALWHQCYFDPPETFTVSASSGTGQ